MGLDPNIWFDNVEIVAARRFGRETVQYVSNIYKYYIAYRLIADRTPADSAFTQANLRWKRSVADLFVYRRFGKPGPVGYGTQPQEPRSRHRSLRDS